MRAFTRTVDWRRLAAHIGLLTLASVFFSVPAFAAGGQGGPSLASCLYPAHSLSGFLSRQKPVVRSSNYNPRDLEVNHAPC